MASNRISRVEARRARGEKIRVILYDRVSGDEQEEEGTSLETQREDNTAYANENGYIIVDVVEETHTGYELDQRKKFISVMRKCASGEADAIVFRTYDRLSRNKAHFTVVLYEAEKYGYELLCVKEKFDKDNMFEAMLRDMVAWFAEFERAKIRERTQEGKRKRAQAGELINGRKPRYGYTYADKGHTRYQEVDEEVKIIHMIDDWYLEGYGQQAIADKLTETGIPTPRGNNRIGSRTTVGAILTCTEYHQEGYAFKVSVFRNERGGHTFKEKPIEERIKLPPETFPQIRTHETFLKIQERLSDRSSAITCKTPRNALLKGGFIRCEYCNSALRTALNHGSSLTYKCEHAQFHDKYEKHHVQIGASVIEGAVLSYAKELLKDLDEVKESLILYINSHSSQASAESYDNAIEKIKEQQAQVVEELKTVRGNARQLLLAQLNQYEDEIERLEKHKSQVVGDGDNWKFVKEEMESVIEWLQTDGIDITQATYERKRQVLKALGIVAYIIRTPGNKPSDYEIRVHLPTLDHIARRISDG